MLRQARMEIIFPSFGLKGERSTSYHLELDIIVTSDEPKVKVWQIMSKIMRDIKLGSVPMFL
jgi:hypothetical protein